MTIVGVTDEDASTVERYMIDHDIKYVLAIGGGQEYVTLGIPHAWLVDAKGKIVWDGLPSRLDSSLITKLLKKVDIPPVPPSVKLPRSLRKASKLLKKGKYGEGVQALEQYIAKPKSEKDEAKAKKALKKIQSYGKALLKDAKKSLDKERFLRAYKCIKSVERSFKGHPFAKEATSTLKTWRKDKTTRTEFDAAKLIVKAEAYINAGDDKRAAGLLRKITKQRKYKDTRTREVAEKLFDETMKRLRRARRSEAS